MSATPRPARLSSPGEVVAILVASAIAWMALIGLLFTLFFAVLIPALQYGGRGEIPSDFPVYPGAHLESAVASSFYGCTTVQATWSTSADPDAVTAFYQAGLSQGDWAVTSTASGRIAFQSSSGPPRNGTVYISTNGVGSQTVIDLTMSKTPSGRNVRCLSGSGG